MADVTPFDGQVRTVGESVKMEAASRSQILPRVIDALRRLLPKEYKICTPNELFHHIWAAPVDADVPLTRILTSDPRKNS